MEVSVSIILAVLNSPRTKTKMAYVSRLYFMATFLFLLLYLTLNTISTPYYMAQVEGIFHYNHKHIYQCNLHIGADKINHG